MPSRAGRSRWRTARSTSAMSSRARTSSSWAAPSRRRPPSCRRPSCRRRPGPSVGRHRCGASPRGARSPRGRRRRRSRSARCERLAIAPAATVGCGRGAGDGVVHARQPTALDHQPPQRRRVGQTEHHAEHVDALPVQLRPQRLGHHHVEGLRRPVGDHVRRPDQPAAGGDQHDRPRARGPTIGAAKW